MKRDLEQLRNFLETGDSADDVRPIVLIVAHPDDEAIGAGARLGRFANVTVLGVTDGAPRNLFDAISAGFDTRENYALARRHERESALGAVQISSERIHELGFADQEASLYLEDLSSRIQQALKTIRPGLVLTHPYEGGHPDHDATAFAVHAACKLLRRERIEAPAVCEMTFYHANGSDMATSHFLACDGVPEIEFRLSAEEREVKQRLFGYYRTQEKVLRNFSMDCEKFRFAPKYDFLKAPHSGQLFYERFDWGTTGIQWRERARAALAALKLDHDVI